MSKSSNPVESNVNLILAIRQNVKGEIAAVDAKIAKREREIAELREERTTLIQMAGAAGVSLAESAAVAIVSAQESAA